MRPDVTLSLIRHFRSLKGVQKFFYDEKVYRVPRFSSSFHEISQSGIESIGQLSDFNIIETISLAIKTLQLLAHNKRFFLDVACADTVKHLINPLNPNLLDCLIHKNLHGLKALNAPSELLSLASIDLHPSQLHNFPELDILHSLYEFDDFIHIDFSTVDNLTYYNGIVFKGFIEDIPQHVLSGGQYDNLMTAMGHPEAKAIGFAVNLDLLGGELYA